ncbi:MAG: hypothetical protein ACRDH9_11785 [Actinomycetota bacterium]
MSIKRVAAVAAALLVTITVVSGLADAAPSQSSKEVLVINDANLPVPTAAQGTTQVAGSVVVANDAGAPVPVDVQEEATELTVMSGQIDLGANEVMGDDLVDIPADKRFIVEYVTFAGFDWDLSVEEDVQQVRLTNQGPPGSPFVSVPMERNAAGRFAASEPVMWAVDGPFVVRVDLDQPASGTGEFAWSLPWTLSGHIVDASA